MDKYFQLKRVLVTGAGKGFGRAIVTRLSQLGSEVIALSRTQADLDSLKHEIPSATTVRLDIADWDKTRATMAGLGKIHMLVNNAGVYNGAPFVEMTREAFENSLDVNFKAAFNITQVVARGMIERKAGGSIVNISSINGKVPFPNAADYVTSKAALDMLTMQLAIELGPYQIRTNSVNPGLIPTYMNKDYVSDPDNYKFHVAQTPLGKLADIKDVVDAVVFLLSDRAASINGVRLNVDGGAQLP